MESSLKPSRPFAAHCNNTQQVIEPRPVCEQRWTANIRLKLLDFDRADS
jgi:hypothetical protein